MAEQVPLSEIVASAGPVHPSAVEDDPPALLVAEQAGRLCWTRHLSTILAMSSSVTQ